MPTPKRALLTFSFDSQFKWVRNIGDELAARGYVCSYAITAERDHAISDQQLADLGGNAVLSLDDAGIVEHAMQSDILVMGTTGHFVSFITDELRADAARTGRTPPVTVSGWVGVIIERILAGFLGRAVLDVVAVNSRDDMRVFEHAATALDFPTDNLLLSGLPILPPTPAPQKAGPIKTILFADQPTIPGNLNQREFLFSQLIDYARSHPDRTVILKPRHRPGEDTFHHMTVHPEKQVAALNPPSNFIVDYTPISETLEKVDLALTVSSTAALEFVAAGVRTAFISDLGVSEPLGNQIFLNSGLLRTFDQIGRDEIGTPTPEWIDDYFLGNEKAPAVMVAERAIALTEVPVAERPSTAVLASSYFTARSRLPEFLKEKGASTRARLRTVRYRDNLKGRALVLATAILPWGVVVRLRERL